MTKKQAYKKAIREKLKQHLVNMPDGSWRSSNRDKKDDMTLQVGPFVARPRSRKVARSG